MSGKNSHLIRPILYPKGDRADYRTSAETQKINLPPEESEETTEESTD